MSRNSGYKTLVHALNESAQSYPDSEAIIINDHKIAYSQLWEKITQVSGFLKEQGFKKGDRASLLIENSIEYVAAYYGVLLAGGIVIGLNVATKSRDLINWLRHSGSSWLFARSSHPELMDIKENTAINLHIVVIDEIDENLQSPYFSWKDVVNADQKHDKFDRLEKPENAATIIYTSGTTGQPKGVTLSHANLTSNIQSIQKYLKLNSSDKVMNVLPFYYSYGNSVLHTHMAVGGSIVLENSLLYPHKVLDKMVDEKVTGFSGVPSTFSLLLSRTNLSNYGLSSLRYITQAGGAMAPSNIKRILELLPGIEFFVMYGQTEGSARLSYLPPERLLDKLGSIGKAIPGVTLEVRDQLGNPVKTGKVGEIWAKGDNIMLGYWEDEESTSHTIINGWLKTGDLAHTDKDGFLYIDGRSTEMIKSGANRISPKDIEEVVAELENIEEVAAVGIPDDILGQAIKLVIVLKPGESEDKKKIMAHCRRNLATYKLPKQIEFTSELPKTASGKIQRFKLQ